MYWSYTLRLVLLSIVIVVTGCEKAVETNCLNPAPGFLISNAQLIDGRGTPGAAADVRITNGEIAAVGALDACQDEQVVDSGGLTLAPGFIDTHSHADGSILENLDAIAAVSQGITTVIVGQDGGSEYPLADFYSQLEDTPPTVNVASYVGHNTLRLEVLGDDFERIATAEEVAEMARLLQAELDSGALGLATGLEYEPGIYSETSEVLALAQITADAGGRYISHIRSEDRWFEDAIDEIILIGRETGMPVQISHIKLAMTRLWGQAEQTLAKLNTARSAGIDITADIYPYEFWQSTMMVLLPDRDYRDRAAIQAVFDGIAPADSIRMTRYEPNPAYVGKSLPEIASLLELDAIETFTHLAESAEQWEQDNGRSAEMIIATSMKDADIESLLNWPHTNICTDGGLQDLHPRGAGSFPRVLGKYARENQLLSMETAVHKMTGLTAKHMGFSDRGFIREGMIADLVLFDPDTVIDKATPQQPDALAEGIKSVWVAGELVYANGMVTEARPGKVIRR